MGDPGCCFENVCKAGRSGRQSHPPPSPADFPSPNARFFLRWHRIWQKLSEAGTWYSFSVPPPFYAFLIFKAIIGLSNKILSNQILSSSLVLWLPFGWKSCGVADVGRALPEPGLAEGTVCLNKVYANVGAAEVPVFHPQLPDPLLCSRHPGSKYWGPGDPSRHSDRPTQDGLGRHSRARPRRVGWSLRPPFRLWEGKLPGHFLKGGVERRDEP